jgi:uncharacterized protein (DUF983 family)
MPSQPAPPSTSRAPSARRRFGWALHLRCPNCGGRPIFASWARMLPGCPVCGLTFERGEQGYTLGAYFFSLVFVETAFSIWTAAFLWWTLPSPPWKLFQYGTTALMLAVPFAGWPFSKTLFLAFDLLVRPPSEEDFAAPHEPAPSRRPRRP